MTISNIDSQSRAEAEATEPSCDRPLVIVTVLHWNGGADTLACLASIHADGYPNLAIVLIDNHSSDDVVSVVSERWPAITVVRNETNLGFTGGQNQAIAIAMEKGADFILMFNQDATFVPGCVTAMVRLAESDERIGLVSPVIRFRSDPGHGEFWGAWADVKAARVVAGDGAESTRRAESDHVPLILWGTALMIRRAVIERIGMLDPRFFAYYEDLDYCHRSTTAGFTNKMCFEASVLHREDASRIERPAYYFYFNSRNAFLWWAKVVGASDRIRVLRIRLAWVLREAAVLRDSAMRAKAEACMQGLWDACVGRFGAYDPMRTAPRWFVRAMLAHPYFLLNLLEGRLRDAKRRRLAKEALR